MLKTRNALGRAEMLEASMSYGMDTETSKLSDSFNVFFIYNYLASIDETVAYRSRRSN